MISAPTTRDRSAAPGHDSGAAWDTELFLLSAPDRAGLVTRVDSLRAFLAGNSAANLVELACSLNTQSPLEACRLALVAGSIADLDQRLERAAQRLAHPECRQIKDASGIHYCERPLFPEGKLAVLFPGEGAQYPHMLADLRGKFPEIGRWLDWAASAAEASGGDAAVYLERFGSFDESRALGDVMCSVMLADWALYQLLQKFSVQPHVVAGHSIGELAALIAAGSMDVDPSIVGEIRSTMQTLQDQDIDGQGETVLLAIGALREAVNELLERVAGAGSKNLDVLLAMDNCPHQSIIVGPPASIARVEAELQARSVMHERLPFGRPYHTPRFEPFMGPLTRMFDGATFHTPRTPVYSCTTSRPFPTAPDEIRRLAWQHWAAPVEFTRTIRAMYDDGVRIFVESGPRGNLTAFVEDILRGRDFLAVPSNVPRRPGITQLNHLLGQLAVHHVPLALEHLYASRTASEIIDASIEPHRLPTTGRGAVLAEYFGVMEQFLDTQRDVMAGFLQRQQEVFSGSGHTLPVAIHELEALFALPSAPEPPPAAIAPPAPGPLVGEIISHVPGREMLVRRRMDLAEDRFAAEHTVGGREVSHIDPDQHGLPVMPMTFTLEMMAEVAAVLVPGKVVLGVRNIQLLRWLAYDEGDPTTVELTAKVLEDPIDASWPEASAQVTLSVRDLGNQTSLPATGLGFAATGVVMLGEQLPPAPEAGELTLANRRPKTRISLETTYTNLFHGPSFQGIFEMGAIGDEGIISQVRVMPRNELFASTADPAFLLDPVLLDVGMHAVAAWHLEQPDQSGRILLPYEMESLRVYGPRPPEGTEFESWSVVSEDSQRQHTQSTDLIDRQGRFFARINKVKCWRFYLPFGDINFHGPKDQYFLGKDWPEAFPQPVDVSQRRAACVKLDPPRDLLQVGMRLVTAHVTLSPEELGEFRRLTLPEKERSTWLFTRIAAKEAVRILWRDTHGRRLFPADIPVALQADNRPVARLRNEETPPDFPNIAWAHSNGFMAGLASFSPHLGIALARIVAGPTNGEANLFDVDESALLDRCGWPHERAAATGLAVKQAIAQALGDDQELRSLKIVAIDAATGTIFVAVGASARAAAAGLANAALVAYTWNENDLVVASTIGEQVA